MDMWGGRNFSRRPDHCIAVIVWATLKSLGFETAKWKRSLDSCLGNKPGEALKC